MSVDEFRDALLRSEEFRRRRVLPQDRLGRMACSPLLSLHDEMPFDERQPLIPYERLPASRFAGQADRPFLEACIADLLHRAPRPDEIARFARALANREISRFDILRELVLTATTAGYFAEIADLSGLLALDRASPGQTERIP
jgi:hypothetical protein